MDKTIYPLTIKAGETATLKVSDTPKVTDTVIELVKIDMETQKDNPQGNASLAGAEFTAVSANLTEYVYICKQIEKNRHIVSKTIADCI